MLKFFAPRVSAPLETVNSNPILIGMKPILRASFTFLFMALAGIPAAAQSVTPDDWIAAPDQFVDASEINLNDFLWRARAIVVFADTPFDPRYIEQMDNLGADIPALVERDVIVITDTDPSAETALRERLRPHGFMLVLIDKDGTVAFRKPAPWDMREIGRSIDKSPLRQQEINARRITQ